jgi:hypothetical protein
MMTLADSNFKQLLKRHDELNVFSTAIWDIIRILVTSGHPFTPDRIQIQSALPAIENDPPQPISVFPVYVEMKINLNVYAKSLITSYRQLAMLPLMLVFLSSASAADSQPYPDGCLRCTRQWCPDGRSQLQPAQAGKWRLCIPAYI